MGDAPTIRPARLSDLPAVGAIYGHFVTATVATFELDPPDQHAWSHRFRAVAEHGLPFLVAGLDGEVGGYAYCTPWKPRPAYRGTVEGSIYVAPWASRRGLGTALLGALLSACSAAQVREVIAVIVDTGDPASAELHRRHNFVQAGRLNGVGFKHGRRLDTLLFQRSLR